MKVPDEMGGTMTQLQRGDFVRVKESTVFRPGQDGMVIAADDGEVVGLMFGFDRHGEFTHADGCTGLAEAWQLDELDLSTIEH